MFKFLKRQHKETITGEKLADIKINDSQIELKKEYTHDILKSKKLPIVLLDPLWHSAKEHIQSNIIPKAEKELQELLKEQGRLNTDFKEYTLVKQNFLKEILVVSNRAQEGNDTAALEELNKLHQSTLSANKKLEEIEARLEKLDEEIEEKNKVIISEMITVGYTYIENYKKENERLENEIVQLREEMLKKTNEKKESEAFLKELYNYLHSIVGRECIEILDKKLGDKK